MESLSVTTAKNYSHGTPWEFESPRRFDHFSFETIIDYPLWKHRMSLNWTLPIWVSIVYIVAIFSIQKFMKNRPAYNVQLPMAIWNLVLGIFSIMGFVRIVPELIAVLSSPNGFHRSVCVREGLNEPMAFWSILFALSKFIELGDTLFIVLRKQPLILLQWYHHCTAMVLAWQIVPFAEPITRYLGVMNYGVHSVMYPYFFLKCLKVHIPRRFSQSLTFLQLLQMIVAVLINVYSQVVLYTGSSCARDPASIKWIWAIYGSYVILFGEFFYKSYYSKKSKKL